MQFTPVMLEYVGIPIAVAFFNVEAIDKSYHDSFMQCFYYFENMCGSSVYGRYRPIANDAIYLGKLSKYAYREITMRLVCTCNERDRLNVD